MSLWDNCKILWAPGMNLHRTPFNSRNHEYYSECPMLTNLTGTAFVSGGLEKGAILSAKHFAFNTQESYREGLSQFMNEQSARELELRGFQGIIEDCHITTPSGTEVNALGLMSSFSRIGCTGVNAHTGLMVNILRKEWGFKGLISTDFVATGKFFNPQDCTINNVTFMACGNASSLLSGDWAEYKNKVEKDPNMHRALKENMHYYLYAIANSSSLNGFDATTKAVDSSSIVSPWQVGFIAGGIVGLIASVGVFATYFLLMRKKDEKEVNE
jgi:beta-glucosidase